MPPCWNKKKVTLEIAGIPMPSFVQLMLKQSINEHHYFEITLDIQAIEAYGVEIPEASKDWVGKKVIMDFGGTVFVGVATMVGLHRSGGTHGNIKVTGIFVNIPTGVRPHLCLMVQQILV